MVTKTIWRLPEVMARTGLPRSTIYHKVSDSDSNFPPPINLGPRAVGWIADEVIDWINQQIDHSRGNES
jgi:prophage regulatory protein